MLNSLLPQAASTEHSRNLSSINSLKLEFVMPSRKQASS